MTKSIKRSRSTAKVADWPTKRDIEHVLNAIGPPATARDFEHILNAIGPPEQMLAVDAAVNMEYPDVVINHVRMIRMTTPGALPSEVKSQLKADKVALERARAALARLPGLLNYLPDNQRLRPLTVVARFDANLDRLIERCGGDLDQLIERCNQATKIRLGRSGGAKAARHDARRREAAARSASELWLRYIDGFPEGERFYTLANRLFKAATGKTGVCKRACVDYLQALHRQVPSIDKRAWRGRMARK